MIEQGFMVLSSERYSCLKQTEKVHGLFKVEVFANPDLLTSETKKRLREKCKMLKSIDVGIYSASMQPSTSRSKVPKPERVLKALHRAGRG